MVKVALPREEDGLPDAAEPGAKIAVIRSVGRVGRGQELAAVIRVAEYERARAREARRAGELGQLGVVVGLQVDDGGQALRGEGLEVVDAEVEILELVQIPEGGVVDALDLVIGEIAEREIGKKCVNVVGGMSHSIWYD